uniref:Uncharacterized protein n=1 Tax=Dactylella tenuis TaxID=383872 RepID=A0A4Y5MZN3_9PEZI|nr:hypothetical protein [Dactylella tenuis]QCW06866.1 hypothetical protein [Dactylella tenuis]
MKYEFMFKEFVAIAPKVYGGILENNQELVKVKGLKSPISYLELKNLLNENQKYSKYQEKWYRHLGLGYINIVDEIYTLMVTDNKREIVYKNNFFLDTKPLLLFHDKVIPYNSFSYNNFIILNYKEPITIQNVLYTFCIENIIKNLINLNYSNRNRCLSLILYVNNFQLIFIGKFYFDLDLFYKKDFIFSEFNFIYNSTTQFIITDYVFGFKQLNFSNSIWFPLPLNLILFNHDKEKYNIQNHKIPLAHHILTKNHKQIKVFSSIREAARYYNYSESSLRERYLNKKFKVYDMLNKFSKKISSIHNFVFLIFIAFSLLLRLYKML